MTREELNYFIIKVFNYYNGKINIINNKAVLDINWCDLGNCVGYSNIPNCICINPIAIINGYNNDYYTCKAAIIETMIHELYHLDQLIDYDLYTHDYNYHKYIEHSCQLQTTIYIADHIKEIESIFGVLFDSEYYTENIRSLYYSGIYYERRTDITHIVMYLNFICGGGYYNKIYECVTQTYKNNKNINLIINNKLIVIYDNGKLISIDCFNENVITFTTKRNAFSLDTTIVFDKDYNLNITSNIQPKNIMCDTIMCKKI